MNYFLNSYYFNFVLFYVLFSNEFPIGLFYGMKRPIAIDY